MSFSSRVMRSSGNANQSTNRNLPVNQINIKSNPGPKAGRLFYLGASITKVPEAGSSSVGLK